jgi:predicted site-specific integrase-resolvase
VTQIILNKQEYYRTSDVCRMAGISKSTLLRWMKTGVVKSDFSRDRRGWRVYLKDEVDIIVSTAMQISCPKDTRK